MPIGEEVRSHASAAALWPVERFLISLTMLVVGLFALLSWDSTFPDRRDVLVLGPLPVRERTLLAAKIAAAASSLALTVVAWNSLAGFAWPIALAPAGSGFTGTLRFVAAFWVTLLAAATFLYCTVLGVQAAASQLPRSWYLRASAFLQIALFALFLGVTLFQPSINTTANSQCAAEPTDLGLAPVLLVYGAAQRTQRSLSVRGARGDGSAGAQVRNKPGDCDIRGRWSVPALLSPNSA